MKNKRRSIFIGLALVLVLGVFAAVATADAPTLADPQNPGAPSGDGIQPVEYVDNPSCADFAPDGETWFELKVEDTINDPTDPGYFNGEFSDEYLTVNIDEYTIDDGDGGAVDGQVFDWTSNIGIVAIFVKGGNNGNFYAYDPEDFADTRLHAPINPNNGDYYGLSHISFCYTFKLDVTKDANTSFTRTYAWDITKTPSSDYVGFAGDSWMHDYTITVDRTGFEESAWMVDGTITIENNEPVDATIDAVSDVVSEGIVANVDCGVTFPYVLGTGETLTCDYDTTLPDGADRINTATVETSGLVNGNTGEADVLFNGATTITEVNATVNVTDDFGTPDDGGDDETFGPLSDDDSVNYSRPFACSTDANDYTNNGTYSDPALVNTATIDETGDSDDATVNVTCYAPIVSKDANTSYTRTYDWTITKEYDGEYWKFIGDPATSHDYEVSVDQTIDESAFAVSGDITVVNPNPNATMTVSLADAINGTAATLDCGGSLVVPPGGTASCGYSIDLDAKADGTNTATATLNGIDFEATADYSFADADVTPVGPETINVEDTNGMSWTASGDDSWNYSENFACPTDTSLYVDGVYTLTKVNTATIVETEQSDTATVVVHCYAPVVSKDANASFTRTYDWTITKEYDDEYWKFIGDPATSHGYEVSVDQTFNDSDYAVSGDITVENPNPNEAMTVSLADDINGSPATLDCGDSLVVPADGTASCGYSIDLDAKTDGTNTTTATLNGIDFEATADYSFADADVTPVGPETINVTDTNGESWTASGDDSWTYNRNFECPTDASLYENGEYSSEHVNTATIVETNQSDSATVTVHCYAPVLSKDASGTFDRTYSWDIEKSVDPASQTGYPGDELSWTWTVTLNESSVDSNYAVSGDIQVTNPANSPGSMTVSLADMLNDGTVASVNCGGGATSVTVAPGDTESCSYNADPVGGSATLNTVTGTFNAIDFTATADVAYTANVINGTANVDDDQEPDLPTTVFAGEGPWTWTETQTHTCSTVSTDYSSETGSYTETQDNTATVTYDTGNDSADASTTYTCQAVFVDIHKTTNGGSSETYDWQFALFSGPNYGTGSGFLSDPLATDSTLGDSDGILDFGSYPLNPNNTYTVCELGSSAGWTANWSIGGVAAASYDPHQFDNDPESLGYSCVDIGAGTDYPLTAGATLSFDVDNNKHGDGGQRTPGYWKNWSSCTNGNQYEKATGENDPDNEFWALDELLPITWGFLEDPDDPETFSFTIGDGEPVEGCLEGVRVLSNQDVETGKKRASDAAFRLARHLLAAQLNYAAGAGQCTEATEAIAAAEALLISLDFNGTGKTYLRPKNSEYDTAVELGYILDQYNNGLLCTP